MHLGRFLIFGCALCLSAPLQAQETTAAGSLGTQASWTALQNMLSATNGNVSVLRTDVDAIKACAAQGKIWQPGKGCVFPTVDTSLYDKIIACGKQGKVYGPGAAGADANGCVVTASAAKSCTTSTVESSDQGLSGLSGPYKPYRSANAYYEANGYSCAATGVTDNYAGTSRKDFYRDLYICVRTVCN